MISHRCRYKARGSVLMRVFTSSSVRWVAARVTLAISSLFSFQSSPPLFYHSTRISIRRQHAICAAPFAFAIAHLSSPFPFDRKGRIRPPFLPGGIVERDVPVASQVQ